MIKLSDVAKFLEGAYGWDLSTCIFYVVRAYDDRLLAVALEGTEIKAAAIGKWVDSKTVHVNLCKSAGIKYLRQVYSNFRYRFPGINLIADRRKKPIQYNMSNFDRRLLIK